MQLAFVFPLLLCLWRPFPASALLLARGGKEAEMDDVLKATLPSFGRSNTAGFVCDPCGCRSRQRSHPVFCSQQPLIFYFISPLPGAWDVTATGDLVSNVTRIGRRICVCSFMEVAQKARKVGEIYVKAKGVNSQDKAMKDVHLVIHASFVFAGALCCVRVAICRRTP